MDDGSLVRIFGNPLREQIIVWDGIRSFRVYHAFYDMSGFLHAVDVDQDCAPVAKFTMSDEPGIQFEDRLTQALRAVEQYWQSGRDVY